MHTPRPIFSPMLAADHARHGFFTRHGGVSRGIYAGLNAGLGSHDNREDVVENRARIAGNLAVSAADLLSPHQHHSSDVLAVDAPWNPDQRPRVDALVTRHPGLAIGVLTADCGPVLFLDPENRVAGSAHAGWKGAMNGVLENTIAAMLRLGAHRSAIRAVLGPTISATHYEVGPEFRERFLDHDPENHRWFTPAQRPDHAMFDLPGYILARLSAAGVEARWTGQCTYASSDAFYSYRRTTHHGEPDYGRQLSAITLNRHPQTS